MKLDFQIPQAESGYTRNPSKAGEGRKAIANI